jgi:hypothetical protein
MPKIKKIRLDKLKKFLKVFLRALGEHAFLTSLVLIFLALIFGGIVFYIYSFSASKKTPPPSEKPVTINESSFNEVLKIWEVRQKRFDEAGTKEYPNPFKETVSTTTAP